MLKDKNWKHLEAIKVIAGKVLNFLEKNKDQIKKYPRLYIGSALVFAGIVAVLTFL